MIFFTSDTHFRHERVLQFSRRPFASIEDMDAALVRNWRDRVSDDDVIYHLGDVAWKTNASVRALIGDLPGTKHLLVGNHDHSFTRKLAAWASVQSYLELQVDRPAGDRLLLVLCHYPFAVWRDSHRGSLSLHGHSHGTFPPSCQQMDVGVDCTAYAPISLPEVLARLQGFAPHEHKDMHGLLAATDDR